MQTEDTDQEQSGSAEVASDNPLQASPGSAGSNPANGSSHKHPFKFTHI